VLLTVQLVVLLLASCVQGVTGFGFAIVSVPLLAAVVGLDHAIAVSGLLGLCTSAEIVRGSRGEIRWPVVRHVLAGVAAGLPAGIAVVLLVDSRSLTIFTGVVVLGVTAALLRGWRVACERPRAQRLSGVLSGALGACTGMTGPPVVVALRGTDLTPAQTRATLAVTLGTAGVSVLLLRAVTGHVPLAALPVAAAGLPLVWIGNRAGRWLFTRATPAAYSMAVVVLLGLSGVTALVPH
jgi:uncharacterized membrane protein YfcA